MTRVTDYDFVPTALTEATAARFATPKDAQGNYTWQPIVYAIPGASCFSSFGRFFEDSQGTEPTQEVFMRFAASTYDLVQPKFRMSPVNYPNGIQKWDHSWPIAQKSPSYNPNLIYQNVKPNWDAFWADPVNLSAGGMFATAEVCGAGYLYICRLSLVHA